MGSKLGNAAAVSLLESKGIQPGTVRQALLTRDDDWANSMLEEAAKHTGVSLETTQVQKHHVTLCCAVLQCTILRCGAMCCAVCYAVILHCAAACCGHCWGNCFRAMLNSIEHCHLWACLGLEFKDFQV